MQHMVSKLVCLATVAGLSFGARAYELPEGYIPISYLESTGKQTIDPNLSVPSSWSLSFEFATLDFHANTGFFGISWGGNSYMLTEQSNNNGFFFWADSSGTPITSTFYANTDYTFTINSKVGTLTASGREPVEKTLPLKDGGTYSGIKIFSCGSHYAYYRFKRLRLWNASGALQHDFVPCIKVDGETETPGLLNIAGADPSKWPFYTASGFVCGTRWFAAAPIETQYYDGLAPCRPAVSVTRIDTGAALTEGDDYRLEYGDNNVVGLKAGSVKVIGLNAYAGNETTLRFDIDEWLVVAPIGTQYYNGLEPCRPTIVATRGDTGATLTEGVDYRVEYGDNDVIGAQAGSVKVTVIDSQGNEGLQKTLLFDIVEPATDLVVAPIPDQIFDKVNPVCPKVVVWNKNDPQRAPLTEGSDYTVTYAGNNRVGTAQVVVHGMNAYDGMVAFAPFKLMLDPGLPPDGYVRLQYLTTDGNQFFATGFSPTANTIVTNCLFCYTKALPNGIGSLFGGSFGANGFILQQQNGVLNWYGGGTTLYKDPAGHEMNFTIGPAGNKTRTATLIVDGSETVVVTNLNTSQNGSLTFFSSGGHGAPVRFYRTTFMNNSTSVARDFIPALRLADNKVGVYDLANSKFYINEGTKADFQIGPSLVTNMVIAPIADSATSVPHPYRPPVTVTLEGSDEPLTEGVDYELVWPETKSGLVYLYAVGIGRLNGAYASTTYTTYLPEVVVDPIADSMYIKAKPYRPQVVVRDITSGTVLTEGTHYALTWPDTNQSGAVSLRVDGLDVYEGTVRMADYTLYLPDLVIRKIPDAMYDAQQPYRPEVVVTEGHSGETLVEGRDYEIAWPDPSLSGDVTLTVNGIGDYVDSVKTAMYRLFLPQPVDANVSVSGSAPKAMRFGNRLIYVFDYVDDKAQAVVANRTLTLESALVVGGGGAGGWTIGGGGGGGGVIEVKDRYVLQAGQRLTLTVGSGAPAGTGSNWVRGVAGNPSSLDLGVTNFVAFGGGGGGSYSQKEPSEATADHPLGCGGGYGDESTTSGSTDGRHYTSSQGNPGGNASSTGSGGGGGAGPGQSGGNGTGGSGGRGGEGVFSTICGYAVFEGYETVFGSGGGGGAGNKCTTPGEGGTNAGKGSALNSKKPGGNAVNGFGGGGGGGSYSGATAGGAGGNGRVILSFFVGDTSGKALAVEPLKKTLAIRPTPKVYDPGDPTKVLRQGVDYRYEWVTDNPKATKEAPSHASVIAVGLGAYEGVSADTWYDYYKATGTVLMVR